MATQCVTGQFTTNGGVLGLDRSAMSRVVARSTQPSTGDGPHGGHAPARVFPEGAAVSPNLKIMIDQRVHWKNDYGVPVEIEVQIQRQRRTMHLSAPNYAFVRERYTHRVGVDGAQQVLAPEPDPTTAWNTEWGGGIHVGLKTAAQGWPEDDRGKPLYGQYRSSMPESTLTLEPILVGVDQSLDVRFRAGLITPYDWWQSSELEFPVAHMEIFSNTILFRAHPQPV